MDKWNLLKRAEEATGLLKKINAELLGGPSSLLQAIMMFCVIAWFSVHASAQRPIDGPVEWSAIIHSNSHVSMEVEFNADEFNAWAVKWRDEITPAIEGIISQSTSGRDVSLVLTFSTPNSLRCVVSARPPLPNSALQLVEQQVLSTPAPRKTAGTYTMEFLARVHGGCLDPSARFSPLRPSGVEMNVPGYETADTPARIILLKRWARENVLPKIGRICRRVDPKFEGVRALGEKLVTLEPTSGVNVEQLSDSNSAYWHATLEMAGGNQLVLAARIHLLAAAGRFDAARRWLRIVQPFSTEKASDWYLRYLDQLLSIFYEEVESRIQRGISVFDHGDFERALSKFEDILSEYPRSGWARHEWLLTKRTLDKDFSEENILRYDSLAGQVFECDPLFYTSLHARTGRQAYCIFRRMELGELLPDTTIGFTEKLLSLADITLDIEEHVFAGHLYWLLFTHTNLEDDVRKDCLNRFVYCMRELGIEGIEENFVGDFDQSSQDIERKLRRRMVEHPTYKAMSRPE